MKKRSLKTTVAAIMLGAALCLPVVSAHATEVTTEAASTEATTEATTEAAKKKSTKNYMKKLKNVKFDLKKDKAVSYYTNSPVIGKKSHTAKITNYKITNAKKKGYKKLTFTAIFSPNSKLSKTEVDKCVKKNDFSTGGSSFFVIDYDTGLELETSNDLDVTVKYTDSWIEGKTYYGTNGNWMRSDTWKVKVTITYPEDYKGLCIGVGGGLKTKIVSSDEKFWDGDKPFGKSSYYSKKESNTHFMRVK